MYSPCLFGSFRCPVTVGTTTCFFVVFEERISHLYSYSSFSSVQSYLQISKRLEKPLFILCKHLLFDIIFFHNHFELVESWHGDVTNFTNLLLDNRKPKPSQSHKHDC